MRDRDIAIVQLTNTLGELRTAGLVPLQLGDAPVAGSAIEIVGAPFRVHDALPDCPLAN